MKIRNYLLNISIALLTFTIGFAWLSVYNSFLLTPRPTKPNPVKIVSNLETKKFSFEPKNEFAIDKTFDSTDQLKDAVKDAAEKAAQAAKAAAIEKEQKPVSDEEFFSNLDISGYYQFVGNTPAEFKDFTLQIWLGGYYEEVENLDDNLPSGYIFSNRKHFEFEIFQYANRTLSFSTYERAGIKYVFSGTYQRMKTSKTNENMAVLKGTLSKLRDGKPLKKSKVEFSWFLGC
ncbi:MAG: hypothetical protein R2681_14070 [Pyrinomonadaceae bacterium]